MAAAGVAGAPPSPLNVRIGPHRRFAWSSAELAQFKAIKDALGGTINDVVLTVVTGALRAHLFRHGRDPEGLELKAMVPISVRADAARGALGNQVAAMYAPLPVGLGDVVERYRFVHGAMQGLKESGQAVGAQAITRLADAAAPTVLDQAARLQSRQRFFNLTVTNVPGPAGAALRARAAARGLLPDGAAGAQHGARDRDHVLRRPRLLRPAGRLRRAGRPRRADQPISTARSASWPRPPGRGARPAPPAAHAARA